MTPRFAPFALPVSATFVGRLLPAALLACLVGGCREQQQITTVTEPRTAESFQPKRDRQPEQATVPGRLIGVLVNEGESTWFFKAHGPDDAVRRQVSQIKGLLVGLKFEGGVPKWTLPDGWKEHRDHPMRFATLVMDDSEPPLELAVSRLPGGQDVVENINRWRGQAGLARVPSEEALKGVETIKTASGSAQYVELAGSYSPSTGAMPPFAGAAKADLPGKAAPPIDKKAALPAGHPPVDMAAAAQAAGGSLMREPVDGPVRYKAPADWQPVPPSQLNHSAFTVTESGLNLRITVSEAQGDLLANINRWREQELNLPPIDASRLPSAVTKLKVDGRDSDFIELIGPADAGPQQAIFVVVVPDPAVGAWFLKLKGDAPLAQRRREQFSEFVASFRIVGK